MNYKSMIDKMLDKGTWAYYEEIREDYKKLDDILEDPRTFIRRYLSRGGKLPNELYDVLEDLSIGRCYHTISIFFLGLILYYENKLLRYEINNYIQEIETQCDFNTDSIEFEYYWFLICFYHDVCSELEGSGNNKDEKNDEKVNKLFSGHYRKPSKVNLSNKIRYLSKTTAVIPNVLVSRCVDYIKYREKHHKIKYDHGITAGLSFYHFRKKGFEEIVKKALEGYSGIQKKGKDVYYDSNVNLMWRRNLLNTAHKDIAWLIIGHNMWFKEEGEEEVDVYKSYNLSDLVIEKPIFNFKEFPLYFLLTFVDTMDIFKLYITQSSNHKGDKIKLSDTYLTSEYCTERMQELCNNINLEINENIIRLSINAVCMQNLFDEIYKTLEKNRYWLPVYVEKQGYLNIELLKF